VGFRTATLRWLLLVLPAAGCADSHFLRQTCPQPADTRVAAETPAPDLKYRVGTPDVLAITFADHPEYDLYASVDLDGRLPLASPADLFVEGRELDDVRHELAAKLGLPDDRVGVRLAAPRSSRVYVHGPIRGRSRVVPYQGPEPVIDLLKRIGGLPPGSKLNQVYVIRPHVAGGGRPEVFRVDVAAVLIDNDQTTNIPVLPSDEIYVGETRRSVVSRMMPAWLGRLYREFVGLLPDEWLSLGLPRGP
jgi:protein involved in polysaccharide export with SLBB domain